MKQFLFVFFLSISLMGLSQKSYEISDTIFRIPEITYFGIDFSHVKFFKIRKKEEALLRDHLLSLINKEYTIKNAQALPDKIRKNIVLDNGVINSLNKMFVDSDLSGYDETIETILKGYKCSQTQGVGLVFMVSELDVLKLAADIYPVFFDIKTRKIIWKCLEFTGAHSGSFRRHGFTVRSLDTIKQGILHGPGLFPPGESGSARRSEKYWYAKVSQAIDSFLGEYSNQYRELKHNETYEKHFGGQKSFSLNGFYVRLIPNEFGAGYQWTMSSGSFFMIELGYRIRYSDSWKYVNDPIPYEYPERPFCYGGPSLKLTLKYDVSRHSSLAVVLGYQHLYCPQVTWDPDGYGGSGSPDAIYQVYSGTNDEFLLQGLHYIRFGRMPYSPVSFFYGIGLKICRITEHFSIDGSEEQMKPSTRTGIVAAVQPLVTFGLLIKIISIPHKKKSSS